MQIDEILTIDTPENVIFGYDVAGIGSRFMAALVDSTIIALLQLLVYFVLFMTMSNVNDLWGDNGGWIIALMGLISFVMLWGYYIFFEMLWNGQSPGKRWVGLRVIRSDGTPITFAESMIRNVVRLIDFLPMYYGVGVVTMFINDQSRRLGDMAAGTLVVREQKAVEISVLEEKTNKNGTAGFTFSPEELNTPLPIEKLTAVDIELAEDFLFRRYALPNRDVLGEHVAQSLYDKMEMPLTMTTRWQVEKVIAIVVRIYHNKNQRE